MGVVVDEFGVEAERVMCDLVQDFVYSLKHFHARQAQNKIPRFIFSDARLHTTGATALTSEWRMRGELPGQSEREHNAKMSVSWRSFCSVHDLSYLPILAEIFDVVLAIDPVSLFFSSILRTVVREHLSSC